MALGLLRSGTAARLQRLGLAIRDRRGRSTTKPVEFVIVGGSDGASGLR